MEQLCHESQRKNDERLCYDYCHCQNIGTCLTIIVDIFRFKIAKKKKMLPNQNIT